MSDLKQYFEILESSEEGRNLHAAARQMGMRVVAIGGGMHAGRFGMFHQFTSDGRALVEFYKGDVSLVQANQIVFLTLVDKAKEYPVGKNWHKEIKAAEAELVKAGEAFRKQQLQSKRPPLVNREEFNRQAVPPPVNPDKRPLYDPNEKPFKDVSDSPGSLGPLPRGMGDLSKIPLWAHILFGVLFSLLLIYLFVL